MNLEWKKVDELPMDVPSIKKILLLYNGKFNNNESLFVATDYWHVFFDSKDFDLNIFDKKKKIEDGIISYGRIEERKIPFNKIKGWMYADDLVNLYKEQEHGIILE